MNFLYPYMLWGFAAVAIPVIIHLFNFRRFKKVYFTNVKYLQELKQQTQRRSNLRHLIILLLRMLAIASLVFAFSKPYIPLADTPLESNARNYVSIYVDNSFSMQARSTNGRLLDIARNQAREVIDAYNPSDQFQLITNDMEGRHQRFFNRDEFTEMLEEVNISPSVKSISEIFQRQQDLLSSKQGGNKISFLISDFQQNTTDLQNIHADTSVITYLMPTQAARTDNLYIDSCWFQSPVHQLNQGVKMIVRVRNASVTDFQNIPVKLYVNSQQKALAEFDVKAGDYTDITLPYTNYETGFQNGMLEITDYPIVYDDRFFFVYRVSESIPVLSINGGEQSSYLNSLFGLDSTFSFSNISVRNINYDSFQQYRLIILNELTEVPTGLANELARFVENGGSLFVIPATDINMGNYRNFLGMLNAGYYTNKLEVETKVTGLDVLHPVYDDVFEFSKGSGKQLPDNTDMPRVRSWYRISLSGRTGHFTLAKLQNNAPFLTASTFGKGHLFLLAVPLDPEYSNFPRHAIFVPTLFKIGLLSAATDPLYYTIGQDQAVELKDRGITSDKVYRIRAEEGDYEFIPEMRNLNRRLVFFIHNQVGQAGFYELVYGDNTVKSLAFNYDRRESVPDHYTDGALSEQIGKYDLSGFKLLKESEKPLTQTLREINQGIRLWKLFLILALVFLAGEVMLLRLWK